MIVIFYLDGICSVRQMVWRSEWSQWSKAFLPALIAWGWEVKVRLRTRLTIRMTLTLTLKLPHFWKSTWKVQETVVILSFVWALSPPPQPHFLEIELVSPWGGVHPLLCVCFLTPPAFGNRSDKSRSCWAQSSFSVLFHHPPYLLEIEEITPEGGGHPQLCVCYLTPLPPAFIGNRSEKSRRWWALSALCALFQPPPRFFGNRNGKSRRWCAPSALCELLHPSPPHFLEIEVIT